MSSQNNKSNKYGKKTTFSREKSYANSEFDIEKNDKKADKYKNERHAERERNIKVANGIEEDEEEDNKNKQRKEENKSRKEDIVYAENKSRKEDIVYAENKSRKEDIIYLEEQFYYEKMNLIVHNLQASRNLDAILKEFTPYGKISYVTYSSVTNDVKLVVDQWYDDDNIDMTFIVDVQCAIFKDGIYKSIGNMNITKDPEQSIREMGDKIIMEN